MKAACWAVEFATTTDWFDTEQGRRREREETAGRRGHRGGRGTHGTEAFVKTRGPREGESGSGKVCSLTRERLRVCVCGREMREEREGKRVGEIEGLESGRDGGGGGERGCTRITREGREEGCRVGHGTSRGKSKPVAVAA